MATVCVSKNYLFLKRTLVLLSPLFLSTLVSRELAFNSPSLNLKHLDLDFGDYENSALSLAKSLNSELPKGVFDYGSLIIQKTSSGKEYWIDQTSPFSNISHGKNYRFKNVSIDSSSSGEELKIHKDNNKFTLKEENFKKAKLENVGDPNLLTVLDLQVSGEDPIQITHVIPLVDLVSSAEKQYEIVKVESKSESKTQTYTLQLKKEESKKEITIETTTTDYSSSEDLSNLAIKSFYVLFNDNPPVNPSSYFTNSSDSYSAIYSSYPNRGRKIFLDKWSSSSEKAKYEFNPSNGFWKSTCRDPYKVGGFIDKKIESSSSSSSSSSSVSSPGESNIRKQLKSFKEFRSQIGIKEKATQQYYYKQITEAGKYVPSSDHDSDSKTPCEKLDEHTKSKLKEYVNNSGTGLELDQKRKIDEKLAPDVLGKEIELSQTSQNGYPHHKLIQSSFRAWGNVYNSDSIKGPQIKDKGLYSQTFENALSSSHSFSIKVKKDKFKSQLLDHEKLKKNEKKLNELEDISTLLEVYYPISFTFYDPISNYLKRKSLYLKTELDLSYLYYQSSFSREVFSYDIGSENGKIGFDYGGFSDETKKTPYGLSGTLKFYAGLSLDKNKDLNIDLTSKVEGFVNTKNPSCDLRHRLYKFSSTSNGTALGDLACSKESGWQYRDYIHIPSFLVISLEREPEVSSFYIDRQIGIASDSSDSSDSSDVIKTLKTLNDKLDEKSIYQVVYTDPSNDGEIYFQQLAAYDEKTKDSLKLKTQVTGSGWWGGNEQFIYYYEPLKQTNEIEISDKDSLDSIRISISGAKSTFSKFFHSNHFNTKRVICTTSTSETGTHDCGDGKKYEKEYKDKTPSEIEEDLGSQVLDIKYSDIKEKTQETQAYEIRFRMVINRAYEPKPKPNEDPNDFSKNRDKYEKIFKDDGEDIKSGEDGQIPKFSCLGVWYSLDLWVGEGNKLKYRTKLRAISLVSKNINNSTSHLVAGAAGSAGFEISKFEFVYKNGQQK